MRTLFLSASLQPQSALALALEFNSVRATLEQVNLSWARGLDHWPSVRVDQFATQLLDHAPEIVHFAGHASPDGEFEMLDGAGRPALFSPDGVARLFAAVRGAVKLVVLNTCYSRSLAEQLHGLVDAIVGVSGTERVDDEISAAFASSFYRYVAQPGGSLARAFAAAQALVEVQFPGAGERLHMHVREGVDPETYCLARDVVAEERTDLLVHVSTEADREALLERFDAMPRELIVGHDDGRFDQRSFLYVAGARREPMTIVVSEPARTGQLWTAVSLAEALATWRPRNLAVLGLAAGDPAEARVGDVVLADKIIYSAPEDPLVTVAGRVDHFFTDARLLALARRGGVSLEGARVRVGVVRSGEWHGAGRSQPASLLDTDSAAAAVAVEACAMARRPALAVVRGVGALLGEAVSDALGRQARRHQARIMVGLIRELARAVDLVRPLPSYAARLRFASRPGVASGWTVELHKDGLGVVELTGEGPQTVDLRWHSRLTVAEHDRGWELALAARADSPLVDTVARVELGSRQLELPLLAPSDRKLGDAGGYRELARFVAT